MKRLLIGLSCAAVLAGCEGMPVQMGSSSAKTVATGSAGGAQSAGANAALEHCSRPLGTMSVYEDRAAEWYSWMSRYGVQSTVPILRLLAQQSNCFVVVERGRGFRAMKKERALQQSGELRKNSNFGKGQMVAADYTVTPTLIFKEKNSGGIGGAIGGLLGGIHSQWGRVGTAVAGAMKFSDAQSLMTLVDNRSGVQVAVAEGSARGASLGGLGGLSGVKAAGVVGGYTKTPEGKVIVGAMMDAFNNLVRASKNYEAQDAAGPGGHGTGGALKVK